ncbi:ATP-binding cassette domain-containing protein [Cupriavidus basilensis]|uniref:ATP-binding cassette domain-containing protein n=1 Tax=Cupriavidus basilensis TaxID=68895 RepID=UPI003F5BA663
MANGIGERSEHGEASKAGGDAVIDLRDIAFTWPAQAAPGLRLDRLRLGAGEQVFVCGPSGSGKSTLLSMLAGVLLPQQGTVRVLGTALGALSASRRDRFRADHVGLVFQQFNLLPYLSVVDNVLLPCRFSPARRERTAAQGETPEAAARALLRQLDLSPALWQRPVTQLSVGQQQRVAAARALIGCPQVVLADEPTSALPCAAAARQPGHPCAHGQAAGGAAQHGYRVDRRRDAGGAGGHHDGLCRLRHAGGERAALSSVAAPLIGGDNPLALARGYRRRPAGTGPDRHRHG